MKYTLAVASSMLLAATVSAQDIAHFTFDNDDLTTAQPSFATVSDLQLSNAFQFGGSSTDRWLCLTTAWNNTGGTASFTVTPNPGVALDYIAFSWDAVTNNPAVSDSLRAASVSANGVLLETFDPLVHLTTYTVDLSSVAALQTNSSPVTIEIDFVGNPNGQSSYEIGQMRLTGGPCSPNCCQGQALVQSIGTGCGPSTATAPQLVSLAPPLFGSTLRVGMDSPSSPNSLALLCFGLDSNFNSMFGLPLPIDLGPFGFPGCSMYCDSVFLTALMLDSNGRAPFQTNIPALAKWCDREITFQAFALTAANELLATQGLRNTVGN